MSSMAISLILLAVVSIMLGSGKFGFTITSCFAVVALVATGLCDMSEAFSGFTNKSVILIFAMFVISAGIAKTDITLMIQNFVRKNQHRPKLVMFSLSVAVILLSILGSAVGTLAMMLPMIIMVSKDMKTSRSKMIYPLAILGNISTACTFLGQGAGNMQNNEIIHNLGSPYSFNVWDFTTSRIPVIITTLIYGIYIAPKLLPDIPESEFADSQQDAAGTGNKDTGITPFQKTCASVICSASVIGMIVLDYFGIMPMWEVASIGAILLVFTGVLTEKEAMASINWPTIFLTGGLLPLTQVLGETGAANWIGEKMLALLGGTTNPILIMAVFTLVPFICTQFMTNVVCVMIFRSLVTPMLVAIGADPRAAILGCLTACCMSFMTPMASTCMALITPEGNYQIKHFMKAGIPIAIINLIIVIFLYPVMFPFFPG